MTHWVYISAKKNYWVYKNKIQTGRNCYFTWQCPIDHQVKDYVKLLTHEVSNLNLYLCMKCIYVHQCVWLWGSLSRWIFTLQGEQRQPAAPGQCCGVCKPAGCVVNGRVYKVSESIIALYVLMFVCGKIKLHRTILKIWYLFIFTIYCFMWNRSFYGKIQWNISNWIKYQMVCSVHTFKCLLVIIT